MNHNNRYLYVFVLLAIILTACTPAATTTPVPTAIFTAAPTLVVTDELCNRSWTYDYNIVIQASQYMEGSETHDCDSEIISFGVKDEVSVLNTMAGLCNNWQTDWKPAILALPGNPNCSEMRLIENEAIGGRTGYTDDDIYVVPSRAPQPWELYRYVNFGSIGYWAYNENGKPVKFFRNGESQWYIGPQTIADYNPETERFDIYLKVYTAFPFDFLFDENDPMECRNEEVPGTTYRWWPTPAARIETEAEGIPYYDADGNIIGNVIMNYHGFFEGILRGVDSGKYLVEDPYTRSYYTFYNDTASCVP